MNDVVFSTGAVVIDFDLEVVAQGPSDINFFGDPGAPGGTGPFVMAASGAPPEDYLTLTSMEPLAWPFAADAAKCSNAIGKSGAGYFAARHKALHACRSALTKGSRPLRRPRRRPFRWSSQATAPASSRQRPGSRRRAASCAEASRRGCSNAVLATLPACAASVDALADPTAATGCLLESVEFNVDEMLHAEFGF